MLTDALGLLVVALATYRLARIPTKDTISEPFRDKLYSWAWDETKLERGADGKDYPVARASWRTWVWGLLTCPLCFGVWTGAVVYSAWEWSGSSAVRHFIALFAAIGVQCFLASKEGD